MHPDSILQKAKEFTLVETSVHQGHRATCTHTFPHLFTPGGKFNVANPDTCMFLEGKRNLCEPGENMFNSA